MHGPIESEPEKSYCDDGLKLRHKLQKLRWMGLERDADEIAREIGSLRCGLPKTIAPNIAATD